MATILIVHDRAPRRRYLAALLECHGHRVLEAADGNRAVATMREARPDLVLVDLLMPAPGGYQLVRRARHELGAAMPRLAFLAAHYMASEARLLAQTCGIVRTVVDSGDAEALPVSVAAALAELPRRAGLDNGSHGDPLMALASRLNRRLAASETLSRRLAHGTAVGAARLAVARSALDREVVKRLHGEQHMSRENQRLHQQSVRDPLTGLFNRRYLEESLTREESRAKRSGRPLAMMMIDIDHFKHCNDTYGHAGGDAVLRAVGRCMESLSRPEDILCRYGGEEFALVMTNTDSGILQRRADALHTGVPKLRIDFEQRAIGPITLSIGLAIYPDHGDTAQAVLQVADRALYRAKADGRDRVVVSQVGETQE